MAFSSTWIEDINSQPRQTGQLCCLRKEVGNFGSQVSGEESIDLDRCFNEKELSSDTTWLLSPVERKIFSDSFNLSDNDWLASWFLAVASSHISFSTSVSFSDGFTIDTRGEEAPLLDAEGTSEKDFKYEKAAAGLECLNVNDAIAMNSPSSCSDSCWSCGFSSSTPLSTKCDSSSDISDLERASYWDSLLNVEEEDSEWILDSKPELDYIKDGFSRPSYKRSWGSVVVASVSYFPSITRVQGSRSEENSSVEHQLEDKEDINSDEPLYWPFEGKSNWNSEESWSSFSISPPKHINCFGTLTKSVEAKLLERKLEINKGCRRRLGFGSTKSGISECKQKGHDAVCRRKPESSRLRMPSKCSSKIAPSESKHDIVILRQGVVPSNQGRTSVKEDFASKKELQVGMGDFALDEQLTIETLVGLKEFDGHEGLDSDLDDDIFMLDESL
ncbi:hypothetical protein L6164_019275 [Bauhinia variegata]|uniref:Uncharacterized protein n=1 Tax=Bauhinia variegata TaxID=167791 RepID=A0ACB9NF09_BAUVA|nr:hypothetical protein L6164_019275 [Bauhinia variegata]